VLKGAALPPSSPAVIPPAQGCVAIPSHSPGLRCYPSRGPGPAPAPHRTYVRLGLERLDLELQAGLELKLILNLELLLLLVCKLLLLPGGPARATIRLMYIYF